jgi:hypothetical protein
MLSTLLFKLADKIGGLESKAEILKLKMYGKSLDDFKLYYEKLPSEKDFHK